MIQISNAERLAMEATALAIEPPPPVDFIAWAEANIVFTDRESPFPGPYNRTLFPYFDEVFRALGPDDPCRTVTVLGSAQVGKTVVGNVFTAGSLALDPCDFLYTHPTEDNARRWSKLKLAPMLRGTVALAKIFPQKSRDGSDAILMKEHISGLGCILISGANSPSSLSQVSMRRQAQDDLSKWEMNSAGDPEAQADSRSRAHEFAKILKLGTPLVMPGCRITRAYELGSQEKPYVPCPHCDEFQVLEWENMLSGLDLDHPELAHFTCTACGCEIEEHHRPAMLARLEWRASNENARRQHRSFWIWSAYSYLQSFERIAREWLKASGDAASEQTFSNDTAGRAYRTKGESPPWESLRDRAAQSDYARGTLPPGALVIFLGIDCQLDRVEWQAVAFGRERRRFIVDYGVIPGHISEPVCQDRLDAMQKQTWLNAFGHRIGIEMTAIDGNAWTEEVWSFAKRHPASKLIMVRGRGEDSAPLLAKVKKERNEKSGKLLRYSSRFFNFGTSVLKMALYRNVAKPDPLARGYVAFPRGLDDEYFRQFTAERRTPEKNRQGFVVYRWTKDPSQANEALDTHLQAEAAAIKWGVRGLPDEIWSRLEAEREVQKAAPQGDLEDLLRAPAPTPAPAPVTTSAPPATPAPARLARRVSRSGYMD